MKINIGGIPLAIGGGLIRGAQFGVYDLVLVKLKEIYGGGIDPRNRIFGSIDQQVLIAGFFGGIGRGLVEGPFEYIKVRRQVHQEWKIREIYSGSGVRTSKIYYIFLTQLS